MVGGRSRRDDAPLKINSRNVFAALETLKKKKKSDKESSKSKGPSESHAKEPEQPPAFWQPTPLNAKSWADVDDDDDDYYATTAPPRPVWGSPDPQGTKEGANVVDEESESEDDDIGIDEGDDDAEEEPEHEPEVAVPVEPVVKKPTPVPAPTKDTERQLSKKELRKKGLAELDALLEELGLSGNANNSTQEETNGEKKLNEQAGDGDKKETALPPLESKSSKKKKAKKAKEQQEQPDGIDINKSTGNVAAGEAEEDASEVDVKERLKKVALTKKKKSNKEADAASKIAASEAAARSAKLAAAKKKEKNHYNQQPVR